MILQRMTFYGILLLAAGFCSCGRKSSESREAAETPEINEKEFTAERDTAWTTLFLRKSGWFGGDGSYSVSLSGNDSEKNDSLLFLFSDTTIGEITGDSLQPGMVMTNNSVAVLRGKWPDPVNITFKTPKENGAYKAIFIPKTNKPDKDTYFWLGDGFVNPDANKDLFIFAFKITNTHDNSQFPFKETGNALIRVPGGSNFPYKDQRQMELPFNRNNTGHENISFGAAVFNNSKSAGEVDGDGFVYVYGVQGLNKKLVAARTHPADIEKFDTWEFWDGKSWSKEVKSAAMLSDSVSNEMSVSRLAKGKYALVYQLGSIFPQICLQVGPTPVGPFGPRIVLYKTTNDINDPDLITYNAKAHAALSAPGELLISYNVNSFKFMEMIHKKPDLYRPRFVRVRFKQQSKPTNP